MEPSKTANQANKMGMTPQHFHSIPTSCEIWQSMHTTKLSTCTLAYSNPLNKRTSHLLTSLPAYKSSAMFSSNTGSLRNIHSNMPYRLSTACALYSFCIQDWPCTTQPWALPKSVPSTTLLHTQTNTWQNGTKCRYDVNVLWCCSYLVCLIFEGSIPTSAGFCSENFFVTLRLRTHKHSDPLCYGSRYGLNMSAAASKRLITENFSAECSGFAHSWQIATPVAKLM